MYEYSQGRISYWLSLCDGYEHVSVRPPCSVSSLPVSWRNWAFPRVPAPVISQAHHRVTVSSIHHPAHTGAQIFWHRYSYEYTIIGEVIVSMYRYQNWTHVPSHRINIVVSSVQETLIHSYILPLKILQTFRSVFRLTLFVSSPSNI